MSLNNTEGSAHTDPQKALLDQRSSEHFQSIFFHTFNDTPGDRVIQTTSHRVPPLWTSVVPCAMPLSSKWNWRSVCMTPHYTLQRERRRNKMKIDPAGTSSHSVTHCFCGPVTQGEAAKRSLWFPSALHVVLRVIGWFEFVCFVSSTSLHVRLEAAGDLPVRPFIYSSFYLNPLSPSVFQLIKSHFSPLLATQFIPDNPFHLLHLSCHRPPSLASLCASSLWPSVSPSSSLHGWQCGEQRNGVHVTVWHVSEPDVVNMLPADSAVELNTKTLHVGPASLHHPVVGVCVAGSKSLLLRMRFKQFFFPLEVKGEQNKLPSLILPPTHIILLFRSLCQPGSESWGASQDDLKWY